MDTPDPSPGSALWAVRDEHIRKLIDERLAWGLPALALPAEPVELAATIGAYYQALHRQELPPHLIDQMITYYHSVLLDLWRNKLYEINQNILKAQLARQSEPHV